MGTNNVKFIRFTFNFQFGLTPEKVGLIFLVNTMPAVIANPIAGLLADKIVSLCNYNT